MINKKNISCNDFYRYIDSIMEIQIRMEGTIWIKSTRVHEAAKAEGLNGEANSRNMFLQNFSPLNVETLLITPGTVSSSRGVGRGPENACCAA